MLDLPRFSPCADSRPDDTAWPEAIWPPPHAEGHALTGKVVELRRTLPEDAPALFAALDEDAVWRHVAGRPADAGKTRAYIETRSQDPACFLWTVRLRAEVNGLQPGSVVGMTCFLETSPRDARTEIGSTLYTSKVWASPVNPEAKLLLLTFAFDELRMGRVQLKTDVRNVRSQQAIARLGASFEGVLRRYQRRSDGTVRDTALFAITAEQWPEARDRLRARIG